MCGWQQGCTGFWWIIPLIMVFLIIGCFFMMRGCSCMPGRHAEGKTLGAADGSALEILDKRYSLGEIDENEYVKMKNRIMDGGRKGS